MNSHLKYRPEIDGLRAIAVLAVIFCHAEMTMFSGGFVGVDMFFVISGYLITLIILREKIAGTFSLIKFYERRARRILPTLFFVMFCCLPFAWLWMLPYQLKEFAHSLIAVPLFASNFLFWQTSGYFDNSSIEKPLLHTWSLGVEEQFYLLFPLLIILGWRLGLKKLLITLVVIAVTSLILSEWLWSHGQSMTNFYLAPTRAWELLIGSLIAFASLKAPIYEGKNNILNNILSFLGLLLIGYSIFAYNETTPTPSLYALAPTIGTALIIAFASNQTIVSKILSLKTITTIGVISYSAYLWHQPLFAFIRIHGAYPGTRKTFLLVFTMLSLLLAYLTWRFIEQPFRNKTKYSRKQIFNIAGIGSLAFIIIGLIILCNKGFEARFPRQWVEIADTEMHKSYFNKELKAMQSPFTNNSQPKILVIGDSFARDFLKGVFANNYLTNYEIKLLYIPSRCQTYVGSEDISSFIEIVNSNTCREFHKTLQTNQQIHQANIIIFTSRWRPWAAERLNTTITNLQLSSSQKAFVVGKKHFGVPHLQKLMKMQLAERIALRNKTKQKHLDINKKLSQSLTQAIFIDQHSLICDSNGYCPLFTAEGDLISYDGEHLTKTGAKYVGQLLFTQSALKTLL